MGFRFVFYRISIFHSHSTPLLTAVTKALEGGQAVLFASS